MDASNTPVRRARPELHTADIKIDQKPIIQTREDLLEEIVIAPEVLEADYQAALKFAEEPVTILIQRTGEKFAPKVVDLWVNGKGPEVMIKGRWVEFKALPVGMPVTTKRKYVEVLARSKVEDVKTRVSDEDKEHPLNEIERFLSSKAPFSVIEDRNPKGAEWLMGLVRSHA